MAYTAIKPCRFAGQSFKVGESVPAEVIQPGAAQNLVKMGIIAAEGTKAQTAAPQQGTIEAPSTVTVTIHTEEGDLPLDVTLTGVQAVFDVLTSNVSDAEPIVGEMTDPDALILLHVSDKRKSVQEAAESRANALSAEQEDEENEGEQ